jgi:MOSC domain-containing protein YiiM
VCEKRPLTEQLDTHLIGTVAAINVSGGGVPKSRIDGAKVSRLGLVGDAQDDKKHHGGPERAVCVYSLDRIVALQAEGHPIDAGTAGENVTIEGIDWNAVIPGVRLRVGDDVLLEVTSYTVPCKTIKRSFVDGKFVRISQKLHPGWIRVYARVLSEGEIHSGDTFQVIPAPE